MLPDRPFLSPARLWLALRRWVWWLGDQGIGFPFWYFLRFEGRPHATYAWKQRTGKRPTLYDFER